MPITTCYCYLITDSGPHKIVDKIFVNTRYFVMKSNNYDNVDIAKAKVGTSRLQNAWIKLTIF